MKNFLSALKAFYQKAFTFPSTPTDTDTPTDTLSSALKDFYRKAFTLPTAPTPVLNRSCVKIPVGDGGHLLIRGGMAELWDLVPSPYDGQLVLRLSNNWDRAMEAIKYAIASSLKRSRLSLLTRLSRIRLLNGRPKASTWRAWLRPIIRPWVDRLTDKQRSRLAV